MKGADTVMSSRVQYNDWLDEEVILMPNILINFVVVSYLNIQNKVNFPIQIKERQIFLLDEFFGSVALTS